MTGMGMFGAILFIPLFMQGVIGVSATQSGSLLTPLMLTLIVGSIASGQVIGRTGRYKAQAIAGLAIVTGGLLLLAGMHGDTSRGIVVRNMIVVGLGLGLTMPVYTVVVQNAVDRRTIGAATAATQFFRQIGGAVGTAIFTSIMLGRFGSRFAAGTPAGAPPEVVAAFKNPLQLVQTQARFAATLRPDATRREAADRSVQQRERRAGLCDSGQFLAGRGTDGGRLRRELHPEGGAAPQALRG